MDRRAFLVGLGAVVVAAPVVFDMAGSWKKHDDLYAFDGIDRSVYPHKLLGVEQRTLENFLKEYYNDRAVANLTYQGDPFKNLGLR